MLDKFSETESGNCSGKKETMRSVSLRRLSAMANPTAAPTKVLEQEYIVWRYSGAKGVG